MITVDGSIFKWSGKVFEVCMEKGVEIEGFYLVIPALAMCIDGEDDAWWVCAN